MAVESQLTRIKTAFAAIIAPLTQTSDQTLAFIRQTLEQDMPQYAGSAYGVLDRMWTFRAIDEDQFRTLTNATLDDAFKVKTAGSDAILETEPIDLEGAQAALLYFSVDSTGIPPGPTIVYDICLDADADDETAGSWLYADESVDIKPDTEISVDIYPTDQVVMKVRVSGAVAVRAMRLRLALIGSATLLSLHGQMIAEFAAARFYDYLWNNNLQAGASQDTLTNIQKKADRLRKQAAGFLTSESPASGGGIGGGVSVKTYTNTAWDRFNEG